MYQPSDDSYFFAEFLSGYFSKLSNNKKAKIKYLDMGAGSGILAETALKAGIKKGNIFAADINPDSAEYVRKKGFKAIKSDLFSSLKGKFDIITFNAPYLPLDKKEPVESQLETTGGKNGDEISINFIRQAKNHLNKNGRIFLLVSSLTPLNRIKKFNPLLAAKKKIWFEELLIFSFRGS